MVALGTMQEDALARLEEDAHLRVLGFHLLGERRTPDAHFDAVAMPRSAPRRRESPLVS